MSLFPRNNKTFPRHRTCLNAEIFRSGEISRISCWSMFPSLPNITLFAQDEETGSQAGLVPSCNLNYLLTDPMCLLSTAGALMAGTESNASEAGLRSALECSIAVRATEA